MTKALHALGCLVVATVSLLSGLIATNVLSTVLFIAAAAVAVDALRDDFRRS